VFDTDLSVQNSLRKRLANGDCVAPIVNCIQKMRVEGVADSDIADLLRHAADELDEAKWTRAAGSGGGSI
jgi:hypothetical protein